ncbi:FAD/NAD(P)-binding protein [Pseudomonas sp. JDS28PS106]|uniref:FAD/NAD(P)-binding protein n=1 Tax=Pseudomonas sp. JDS28PS106 TaxID=2497235 RepID=UPI002FD6F15D
MKSTFTDHWAARMAHDVSIAIVGMGSRGFSVLEQLVALARQTPSLRLRIDLFDPRTPGVGLHDPEQPDYLMLNTMAGQLSAFSSAYPADQQVGETFLQWCQATDVRLDERGHVAASGRAVAYGDFVPRRLLGRYLQHCYRVLLRQCPANVRVRHQAETVSRCEALSERPGFRLTTASGWRQAFDALFVTLGHAPCANFTEDCGARVAIEGLGLTAMDTLARLTEGRGGRFVRDAGFAGWRYQPSGREPQLFLYSRSGLPFHARPAGATSSTRGWPRLFLTFEALDALRRERAGGRLDFRADVLPLLEDEMRAVYYQAVVVREKAGCLTPLQERLRDATSLGARQALFETLVGEWGRFEPCDWMPTATWQGNGEDYAQWFRRWITEDLALSRLGTAGSPLRQALELWRDCRDLLRHAVDRGGLTENSTHDFYAVWAGVSNRLVGGPQLERYEDLLALLEAGVVTPLAPGAARQMRFDTVIRARVVPGGMSGHGEGLLADLHRQGLVRAAHQAPADGIETDAFNRALYRDGTVHSRLWVLGPSVEGCTFYNHYVPTPDPQCLAPRQARIAAQSCLDSLIEASARATCA